MLGSEKGGDRTGNPESLSAHTCDHFTELVLIVVLVQEVSQAHDHQSCNGGQNAQPLARCQPPTQEGHGKQPCEYDYCTPQHLEAGGTGHVQC